MRVSAPRTSDDGVGSLMAAGHHCTSHYEARVTGSAVAAYRRPIRLGLRSEAIVGPTVQGKHVHGPRQACAAWAYGPRQACQPEWHRGASQG